MLRIVTALVFGFLAPHLLRCADTAFLVPRTVFEKTGLKNILALPNENDLAWKKYQALEKPFHTEIYQLFFHDIKVQNCIASVGIFHNKVFVSASYPENAKFSDNYSHEKNANAEWILNPSGKYELYQFTIQNKCEKKYHAIADPGLQFILDERRNYAGDTWTMAKVFRPDPLSPDNILYGGIFRDRGDSNYTELANKMVVVKLWCKFQNDSFRLENQWLHFREISDPVSRHAIEKNNFYFTRDQKQFEEVNAFYHLTNVQRWWDTLGFSAWKDTVSLDVHAMFGSDDSYFNPLSDPPTIEFGDGGVDDAEDADAVVHEYTHAAFQAVIPGGYAGTQRQGVEEGICDFMAVCYSRKWNRNQAGWVYNWDGHNEFWNGRTLENSRYYPTSLTNQTHVDGQLFGGALNDLAKEIGDDSAVKIVMAAMPFMVPGINMRRAAELMLYADSFLNNGRTRWPLVKAFYARGLLLNVGTKNATAEAPFRVRNTAGFALGGSAEIYSLAGGMARLLDACGRVVMDINLQKEKAAEIDGAGLRPGVYFLEMNGYGLKLLRQ